MVAAVQDVQPGSTWQNRRTQARVSVVRTTDAGTVLLRTHEGKRWSMRLGAFRATFVGTGELHHVCARCGATNLRLEDKYCKECQAAIARFRHAKKHTQEDDVLTTNSRPVIEQRLEDERKPSPPAPQPIRPEPHQERPATQETAHAHRWRIVGRVTLEVYVEGATVIDALSDADAQYAGIEVTDVHLLD
jgi:ribosomal protein L37E